MVASWREDHDPSQNTGRPALEAAFQRLVDRANFQEGLVSPVTRWLAAEGGSLLDSPGGLHLSAQLTGHDRDDLDVLAVLAATGELFNTAQFPTAAAGMSGRQRGPPAAPVATWPPCG